MVIGYIQNKELVGDNWSPTDSMSTLRYFLADAIKHKARMYQLDFIVTFLQEYFKNRVFVKLDSRYADYFPEYSNYFGRALRLLKYIYGMTNSVKLFADELTEWILKAGFIQYQCQMSIYSKYALDVGKLLFCLTLMTVYIDIYLNPLGNGLWIL